MSTATNFMGRSLFMVGGLIVWAIQFGVIYAFNALACARGFSRITVLSVGIVPFAVAAATLVAALATALILFAAYRRRGPSSDAEGDRRTAGFMRYTTMTVAALALVAIVYNGVPAFIVPPCG